MSGNKSPVAFEKWIERTCWQLGACEVLHNDDIMGSQIDVSAQFPTALGKNFRVAFEAKDYAGIVGIKLVRDFARLIDGFRTHNKIDLGIMLARTGFTPRARERARSSPIKLMTYYELKHRSLWCTPQTSMRLFAGPSRPIGQSRRRRGLPTSRKTPQNLRQGRSAKAAHRGHRTSVNVRVAGRLCLFGEHSDWAADYRLHRGRCLVVGTDQCLSAVVSASSEFRVQHVAAYGDRLAGVRMRQCGWNADHLHLIATDPKEYFRFCAGVAHEVFHQKEAPGGIDLRIAGMDLPIEKGVASSAAVCLMVAKAFNDVYSLGLSETEIMGLAYRGERLAGSTCGRMDQACIFLSRTPVLLTFDVSGDTSAEMIWPDRSLYMFFVDLDGRKNTTKILKDLHEAYRVSRPLQRALGAENDRIVEAAKRALAAGDAEKLGALMREAQRVFDKQVAPHSPLELASPLLHGLLECREIQPYIYGGKGVGSQGDGTAQFVARDASGRDSAMAVIAHTFPGMRCFSLTIDAPDSKA